MKTFAISHLLYIIFFLAFLLSCSDNDDISENPPELADNQPWQDALLDFELASTILVDSEESIQDAIDLAEPGEQIFITPGNYGEKIKIDKELTLIGLDGYNDEKVSMKDGENLLDIELDVEPSLVTIHNILYKNAHTNLRPYRKRGRNDNSRGIIDISHETLSDGVAHYIFKVRLGEGKYDVVRIHRVVKESRKYRPERSSGDIFMIHGASQDFDDIFLTAGAVGNVNAQTSSPVYLASKGIDVWGIDLGWTLVPIEETDFGFMEDWGLYKDVDHTMRSLRIARLIRGLTRQGFGKMNLLGFSYGVRVAYAAAGEETKLRRFRKSIKGLIPADGSIKLDPNDENTAAARGAACGILAFVEAELANGNFVNSQGAGFISVSQLAINAPNEPSPIPDFNGLTNFQAALVGAVSPSPTQVPDWHFVAGEFGENGIPTGLANTDVDRWFNLGASLAPHMPAALALETFGTLCETGDVQLDDNLADITIPIYYIGAGGGMGTFGEYTSSLTGSQDISSNIVDLKPEGQRILDYGHADIWMANNAPELVWEPLYQWLVGHDGSGL